MNTLTKLNKDYITNNFKLPDTNIIVFINGVYEKGLSDHPLNLTLKDKTLKIAKNNKNKTYLHLLFLSSENHQNRLNLIVEENSHVNIIEEHTSLKNQTYLSEIEINITIKPYSNVYYQKFRLENIDQTNHQVKTFIKQEKNSKFVTTMINKGVKSAFDLSHIKLTGEYASYDNKSINLLNNHQNMDNQIQIEHLTANCTSNVIAKNVVDDNATSNFSCRVIAHAGATNTETHVTNKNLLLAKEATANTAPELEIYVDDVICTHGATVGQLDEKALFYLRSRGIKKDDATKILTNAFIQEITDQITKYNRFKTAANLNYG